MKQQEYELNNNRIERFKHNFRIYLFVITALLFSCTNDLEKIRQISNITDEKLAVETIYDGQIIYSDSANVKLILNSKLINRYSDEREYIEFMDGVRVQFYNVRGKKESEISAQYAILDYKTNLMEAKYNVIVRNNSGDRLESEHLIWDEERAEVYTEEDVKIVTSEEVLYGTGLVSNQDFTKYTIKKIHGSISLK